MKVLSFFSGAMGLDIGLENSGFKTILTCDNNKYCQQTINYNKPDIPILSNIFDISSNEILEITEITNNNFIICGGPPCQSFSTAGKRKSIEDSRGIAIVKYIDIIKQLKPMYFVLENVRGIYSSMYDENNTILEYITTVLSSVGYNITYNLYNSMYFNVAQSRERMIMMGSLKSKLPYLIPTTSNETEYNLSPIKTFRDISSNITHHHYIQFPEKRLKYYKLLTSGQNWKNLPISLQKEALGNAFYSKGGKTGFLRRLDWDKPSPTLLTSPTMPATDLAHPSENRPLSIEEYKRIQGFSDEWVICGNLKEQYKQIGNSIPIGLGESIGHLIKNDLNNTINLKFNSFKFSRYNNTGK